MSQIQRVILLALYSYAVLWAMGDANPRVDYPSIVTYVQFIAILCVVLLLATLVNELEESTDE